MEGWPSAPCYSKCIVSWPRREVKQIASYQQETFVYYLQSEGCIILHSHVRTLLKPRARTGLAVKPSLHHTRHAFACTMS
jgi:hypothetical protein